MSTRVALVLSAGGMFGAWQAGAWRALAGRLRPDLIVGASIGALNGYAIAGGAAPEELCRLWLRSDLARLEALPETIAALMARYPLRQDYAVVLTDILAMKPRVFCGADIEWRHLAASCAIPILRPQPRIGGRWYSDGGLLNPLPVWAAVECGATHIVALHALPEIPAAWLKPFVRAFRGVFGYNPPLPSGVPLLTIATPGPLGSIRDALHWRRENIERWIEQGDRAARNISVPDCFAG